MSKEYLCRAVDRSFIEKARFRFTNSVDLPVTPDQAFEILADVDSWPHWVTIIKKATWTSPGPPGVGTMRTVHMTGGIVGNEEFLAWEPGVGMAFRFNSCSTSSVAAFAEDYRIEPTPSGCNLTWTLAMAPAGVSRVAVMLVQPIMNLSFRRFLTNLSKYAAERYPAPAQRPAT
ncbi:SRPBCC family protein [Aldersonia sp. NBC_00410]|uniref:SRPBCC family protein n=1 Tax=Aldersonia sp. NBC_00410 TaxID=2975954 RepID=UPI0022586A23|nr:SRPBCC family protein [Aldersonia sp. NBC_00410]MCX5043316.1 SRPBCC family protein [Aldersonia sp. NBC_00410]